MPLDQTKIDHLKTLLVQAEQIADVFDYFFDHFGNRPDFANYGSRVPATSDKLTIVEAIIGQVVNKMLRKPGQIQNMLMIDVGVDGFFHGACLVGRDMVTFVYFDALQTGAMAIAALPGTGGDDMTHFSRFSTTMLTKKLSPMSTLHAAPKKRTIH